MVSIFMPMISEAYKKRRKNEIKETYFFSNVFSALASGAILISFSAFGAIVLSIFGVGNLEIIYFILLALSVRTFIGSLAGPTGALLNMADRHKLEIFNTIILMVLNILLNYFMIKEYGVLGAGLATLFGGIAAASIRSLEVCKIYEFFIYRKIHLFIFLVVSFFVVGGLLVNSYQKSLFFNIGFFIFGEAFLFSVVYNLLDQNQKAFLKEKVKHCFKLGMYLRNKPPF
jgi:O-antigen/teichoic acid export membrane protein